MTFISKIYQIPLFGLLLIFASCSIESLFPYKVANGAARLTIKNLGNLPRALNHDELYRLQSSDKRPECDFRSLSLTESTRIEMDTTGNGRVIRDFANCSFDFSKEGLAIASESLDGCEKTTTTFYGKVSISGSRILSGILTSDSNNPIIPSGDNAVEFKFSKVEFQNYRVDSSDSAESMTIATGSAAFDMVVHLGKDESSLLCKIPLPNITLANVRYSPSMGSSETIVKLNGPLGEFRVPINHSNLSAQVGVYGTVTNQILGEIKVWDSVVTIPTTDSTLDPDFTTAEYDKNIAQCIHKLKLPTSDVCNIEPELATNVSRLVVSNLGHIVLGINSISAKHPDPSCRLDRLHKTPTMQVIDSPSNGKNQALVEWTFEKCEYDFGTEGILIDDTHFFGKVTVSGKRRAYGLLTGDENIPVIPSVKGVEFDFSEVIFDNYELKIKDFTPNVKLAFGQAAFKMTVHLEKDGEYQIHQDPTSNLKLTFEQIKFLQKTRIVLDAKNENLTGVFQFDIFGSDIYAQAGIHNGKMNTLEGSINMFGKTIPLPSDGLGLNPFYPTSNDPSEPSAQDTSYELVENLIADGLARLTINNLGNMLLAVTHENQKHTKPECDLVSVAKTDKMSVHGTGKHRTVTWKFDGCEYDFGKEGYKIDASDKVFYGKVVLSGEKTIDGYYIGEEHLVVIPTSKGVSFKIDVGFANYSYESQDFDESLMMVSGQVHFDALVHLARDKTTDLCIEPIHNLTISNVSYSPSTAILRGNFGGGLLTQFETPISSSHFSAQVGYGETEETDNQLRGMIEIFGRQIQIPTDGKGLDPSQNHLAYFEGLLAKQSQLATTNRHEMFLCRSFEEVEALTIARLLTLNTGSIAQESFDEYLKPKDRNWDEFGWDLQNASQYFQRCGFNSNWTKMKTQIPLSGGTSGAPGTKGRVELNISECEVINLGNRIGEYPLDCLATRTLFTGNATVTGKQIVHGIRMPFYEKFGYEILGDISPNHPEATSLHLTQIKPNHFSSYFIDQGENQPKAKLTLKSGLYSADLFPVLAAKKGYPCEYYRATPVVGFKIRAHQDMPVKLDFYVKGISFSRSAIINFADYSAYNGFYNGDGNYVRGKIMVNGKHYEFADATLNPFYDQETFDRTYSCREHFPRESEISIEKIIHPYDNVVPNCENVTPHGIH